jgi:hypothetical protein
VITKLDKAFLCGSDIEIRKQLPISTDAEQHSQVRREGTRLSRRVYCKSLRAIILQLGRGEGAEMDRWTDGNGIVLCWYLVQNKWRNPQSRYHLHTYESSCLKHQRFFQICPAQVSLLLFKNSEVLSIIWVL